MVGDSFVAAIAGILAFTFLVSSVEYPDEVVGVIPWEKTRYEAQGQDPPTTVVVNEQGSVTHNYSSLHPSDWMMGNFGPVSLAPGREGFYLADTIGKRVYFYTRKPTLYLSGVTWEQPVDLDYLDTTLVVLDVYQNKLYFFDTAANQKKDEWSLPFQDEGKFVTYRSVRLGPGGRVYVTGTIFDTSWIFVYQDRERVVKVPGAGVVPLGEDFYADAIPTDGLIQQYGPDCTLKGSVTVGSRQARLIGVGEDNTFFVAEQVDAEEWLIQQISADQKVIWSKRKKERYSSADLSAGEWTNRFRADEAGHLYFLWGDQTNCLIEKLK